MVSDAMKAYMAGIIDGEGCITIGKQIRKDRISPAYRSSITVSNTNKQLIDLFVKYYEGVAYERRNEKRKEWAVSYTWHCKDTVIIRFISDIIPYLILKKEQAEIILVFQETKKNYERKSLGQGKGSKPLSDEEIAYKETIYNKIRLLNTKGKYARQINNL